MQIVLLEYAVINVQQLGMGTGRAHDVGQGTGSGRQRAWTRGCVALRNVHMDWLWEIVPLGAPTFREALRWGAETYHALKAILKQQGLSTNVGDEGGFAPNLASSQAALDLILTAIDKAGFNTRDQIKLALDVASTEFCKDGHYHLAGEGKTLTSPQMVEYLSGLVKQYPIISIEDGMAENDWDGWMQLTEHLGSKLQLVGDDLLVTNPERVRKAIKENAANALLEGKKE